MKKVKVIKSWNVDTELEQLKYWKHAGAKAAVKWLDAAYEFAYMQKKTVKRKK